MGSPPSGTVLHLRALISVMVKVRLCLKEPDTPDAVNRGGAFGRVGTRPSPPSHLPSHFEPTRGTPKDDNSEKLPGDRFRETRRVHQWMTVNRRVARRFFRAAATDTLMILPQVHLRKPCYDFYFL